MGARLHHEYEATDVSQRAVREALAELDEDDISASSPITPGASEVAVQVGDDTVTLAVAGHDGDWTKTSEQAVKSAVQSVPGVGDLVSSEGGYDSGS